MKPRAVLAVVYATGRAFHARQIMGNDPDEKGYSGPPGWELGMGLTTPHHKNNLFQGPTVSLGNFGDWLLRRPRLTLGCSAERMDGFFFRSLYM
jgi:hypothetical protein